MIRFWDELLKSDIKNAWIRYKERKANKIDIQFYSLPKEEQQLFIRFSIQKTCTSFGGRDYQGFISPYVWNLFLEWKKKNDK